MKSSEPLTFGKQKMQLTSSDTTTLNLNAFQIWYIKYLSRFITINEVPWSITMTMNAWYFAFASDSYTFSYLWACASNKESSYNLISFKPISSHLHNQLMVFSLLASFTCTSLVHTICQCINMLLFGRSFSIWFTLLLCNKCSCKISKMLESIIFCDFWMVKTTKMLT